MITQIFSVVAPLFICAGIGYLWGRLDKPFDANMVTGLALQIGVPCLIFSTLTKLQVHASAFAEIAGAYLLALGVFLAVAALLCRVLGLEMRAYMPALTFKNSGNMGLPVCLFAFGDPGLALGICIFVIASLGGLTLGRGLYSGATASEALIRNPLVYAILVSLVFMVAQIRPPTWLANTVGLLSGMSIPLMIISLGVAMSKLTVRDYGRTLVISVIGVATGFAVGSGLAAALGLGEVARGVLIIQCSMPVAVHNYVFAQRYGRRPEEIAGMVLISTLVACAALPAVLLAVL